MSTQPNLSPLEQLGQDVQQAQPEQSAPSGSQLSPLELLGQEVQKQQAPAQAEETTPYVPNARIRNLPNPAAKATSATDALLDGMKTGAELTAIPATAIGLGEAGPVIAHLAEHLPNLGKAYQVLKTLGGVASGTGGTLYTLQHLKDVLKIIGGGNSK